jgi:hypothetical protein
MNVPEVIPISHEPGYHTDTIGWCRGGQFYGTVVAAVPEEGWSDTDWQRRKRWCAVLHRFDPAGRHLESRVEFTGTTADGEREVIAAAQRILDGWLEALPERRYGDIAIAPFSLDVEGTLFGLVLEERDGEISWAELYPDGLGFSAPWDGCYDT